jgi:hypothetical protein
VTSDFTASRSILSRLITSVFLLSWTIWLAVLLLSCSLLTSRRRSDIANSARNRSLPAWISAIDCGSAASIRRMVSRTARS